MANDLIFGHEQLAVPSGTVSGAKNAYLWNDFYMRATGMLIALESYRNSPPSSPSIGDTYLLGTSPTGVWSGHAHKIAVWFGNGWRIITPKIGMRCYVQDVSVSMIFTDQNVWHGPERIFDLGTLGTVGVALSCATYGIHYWRFSSSGVTVTLLSSIYSTCVRGLEYTFIAYNNTGANCTVSLQSTGWVCSSSSFTVANNSMLAFKAYRAPTENRMIVSTVTNGLVNN